MTESESGGSRSRMTETRIESCIKFFLCKFVLLINLDFIFEDESARCCDVGVRGR